MKLIAEVHPDYCPSAVLYKWASQRTGLELVLVRKQTPAVNGYFPVATEINNSSGCPHTLEHLVFMGSKKYPFKGLLDILGNKELSSTNAWTAQDQTVYQLNTAGWEGFKTLLPVYVDHILNPTLTDAACLTEVYHVDGNADERGVVFSEMQGVENGPEYVIARESQRLLFDKDSGYATDTGGLMSALRELTPEMIREYHAKTYAASNLSLIIVGDVEPEDLLQTVEAIDSTLPDSKPGTVGTPGNRPFIDSSLSNDLKPLTEDKTSKIEFPDKDEEFGEVKISYVGPQVSDLVENTALEVLKLYLTLDGAGKLQVKFVDVDDALSTNVSCYTDDYLRTIFNIYFEGVPNANIEKTGRIFGHWFRHTLLEEFDIDFMRACINRARNSYTSAVEENADMFAELAIVEFLYGKENTFRQWTESVAEFDTLLQWTRGEWLEFLSRQFVANKAATVVGSPSERLYEQYKVEAQERKKKYQESRDLKKDKQKLADAQEENDRPIPSEILDSFLPPDVSKINFIESKTAATPLALELEADEVLKLDDELMSHVLKEPEADISAKNDAKLAVSETIAGELPIVFEQFPSQFIQVSAYFSAEGVDSTYLPLVAPVLQRLFEMPMKLDDGTEYTGKEVAELVKQETIHNGVSSSSLAREYVKIGLLVKASDFNTAVKWLARAIGNVVWEPARIGVFLQQHISSLSDERRQGSVIAQSTQVETMLRRSSLCRQSEGLITETDIHVATVDLESTAASVKNLARQLFRHNNVRILVHGDVKKISQPIDSFGPVYEKLRENTELVGSPAQKISPVPATSSHLTDLGKTPKRLAVVTLSPGSESAYVIGVSRAPTDFSDKDLPAMTLANAYLQAAEGPLWRAVRGAGFAYGASVETIVQSGFLEYTLYRASDVSNGIAATRATIEDIASGKTAVDKDQFSGALSSVVSSLAVSLSGPSAAAKNKFMNGLVKARGPNFIYELIANMKRLTPEDLVNVLQRYYVKMFDPNTSMVFVATHPLQGDAVVASLKKLGYDVDIRELSGEASSESESESDSDSSSSSSSSSYEEEVERGTFVTPGP